LLIPIPSLYLVKEHIKVKEDEEENNFLNVTEENNDNKNKSTLKGNLLINIDTESTDNSIFKSVFGSREDT